MDNFLLSIRYVGIERERLFERGDGLKHRILLHDILQNLQRKWLSHLLYGKVSKRKV